jgi:hypothetical protein
VGGQVSLAGCPARCGGAWAQVAVSVGVLIPQTNSASLASHSSWACHVHSAMQGRWPIAGGIRVSVLVSTAYFVDRHAWSCCIFCWWVTDVEL